jgi:hypothetical protein
MWLTPSINLFTLITYKNYELGIELVLISFKGVSLSLITELLFIITLHGPRRKHSLSIVGKACLQHRCIATDVTRLLFAYSFTQEYVY